MDTHSEACVKIRDQLVGVHFLLPSCQFQGPNSNCSAWWQAPLPTEPCHWPYHGIFKQIHDFKNSIPLFLEITEMLIFHDAPQVALSQTDVRVFAAAQLGLGVMVWHGGHLVPVSSPLPSRVLRCGLSQNVFAQDRKSHFKVRESRRGGGGGAARQRGHKPHSPTGPERSVSSRPFASIIEHFLSTHPVQPVFKDNFVCSDGNWVSLEQVEKLSKLRLSVYVFLHRRCRTHPRGSGLASASNKTKDFFGFVFNQWYL